MHIHRQNSKAHNELINSLVESAGIAKNISSHIARNTFAMRLLNERKRQIHVVSKLLGHHSVQVTENHYAHRPDFTINDLLEK